VIALRTVLFVAGVGLVVWTVMSAIRTVILPRSAQSLITRAVFRSVRIPFRWVASERRSFNDRDRVMAMFAPIGLVTLAGVWMAMVTAGYSLMYWALDWSSAGDAFHLSGSSITTLGFAPADTSIERLLAFTEAGWGLFMVTLMITFLPTMYAAFSKRETQVALLEVRAGDPPSAIEFLIRHYRIGWLDRLDETWLEWERWFAELEETHTTYAALNFFRSPQPSRSWVTAAGTMLDSASLMAAAIPVGEPGPKGVCIRSGYLALRRIAEFFAIPYDPEPGPDTAISITRQEFDEAWSLFAAEGIPLCRGS
jgi:hypothetical protein